MAKYSITEWTWWSAVGEAKSWWVKMLAKFLSNFNPQDLYISAIKHEFLDV